MKIKKVMKKSLTYSVVGVLTFYSSGCGVEAGVEHLLSGSFDSAVDSFYPNRGKKADASITKVKVSNKEYPGALEKEVEIK